MLVLRPERHQTEQFGHPVGAERNQLPGGRFGVVVVAAVERHGRFVAADPEPKQVVVATDVEFPTGDRGLGAEPEASGGLAGHLGRESRDAGHGEHRLGRHQAAHAPRVVVDGADHLLEGRLFRQGPRQRRDPDLVATQRVRAGRAGGGQRDDDQRQEAGPRARTHRRNHRPIRGGRHAASPDQRRAASRASTAAAAAGSGGATLTTYSQSRFRQASRSGSASVEAGAWGVAEVLVG